MLQHNNEWKITMAEKILLKKYANRRLYDTEKSRYVTLNEVAERIRNGQQVEIIDAKTKADVTAFILTQIVLEEAKNKNVLLPVPFLYMIIRYGDNVLVEFFEKYLQQAIKGYLAYKSSMDDQFKKWLDMGMGFSEVAQKSLMKANPFQSVFEELSKEKKSAKKKPKK